MPAFIIVNYKRFQTPAHLFSKDKAILFRASKNFRNNRVSILLFNKVHEYPVESILMYARCCRAYLSALCFYPELMGTGV